MNYPETNRRIVSWWCVSLLALALILLVGDFRGPQASTPTDIGYRSFSYGSTGLSAPTGEKPESKLWFHDGYWWGSLYNDTWEAYHIYRFDPADHSWTDTGVVLDDRNNSLADCLWDDTSQKLYVVSHVFTKNAAPATDSSQWGRLYRYSYDPLSKTYSLDTGFPVNVTRGKSETLVVAKDSTGKLWVTWVESGNVMVNASQGDDLTWGEPFILPVNATATAVTSDDISSIVAFAGDKVGVMWSNQNTLKFYFAVHNDADPETVWQTEEAPIPGPDNETSDDHINLKSLVSDGSGRVFAAIKTSLTASNAPLVMLLVRNLGGNWSRHVFGRVSNHHTRPVILLDEENSRLYLFATSPEGGGAIYYKSTDLNSISFPLGTGTPILQSSLDPKINNVTSTKQNLNSTTGLLILASDSSTSYYLHNFIPLTPSYNLNVTVSGSGSVSLDPPGGKYPEGSLVAVTATADPGWQFTGWSGDVTGTANPISVTMDADKNVTATFTELPPGQYTLSTQTVGSGTVSVDPPGGIYDEGTVVTLTATPDEGWVFSGWSGSVSGSSNPLAISMDSNKTVTATFDSVLIDPVFEEVQTGVSASSTSVSTQFPVTAATGHLYLAAVSSRPQKAVTSVTGLGLTWTELKSQCGARSTNGISLWVAQGTPTGNSVVTANFDTAPQNAVLAVNRYSGISTADPIGNIVSANTLGVDGSCAGGTDNSLYQFDFTTGLDKSIIFVAAAMRNKEHFPGVGFVERAELSNGSGGNVASVAVSDQQISTASTVSVQGTFSSKVDWAVIAVELRSGSTLEPALYNLTVSTTGAGVVEEDPPGGVHTEGTEVTLTAFPDLGHVLASWGGDASGSDNPIALLMDSDKNVTATFEPLPAGQVELRVDVLGFGAVDVDPPGWIYDVGTSVTLTANPGSGYEFSGWSGDLAASANPVVVTMDTHKEITATFNSINSDITLEEVQSGSSSGLSTVSTSLPLTAAAEHLYVASVAAKPDTTVSGVSGLGLTWSEVKSQCGARSATGVSVWIAQGMPASDGVVTATLSSAPSNAVLIVTRYSSVSTVNPVGNIGGANTLGLEGACSGGTDTSSYSFPFATGENGSLVHVSAAMRNRTHTPGAGYTELAEVSAGSGGSTASAAVQEQLFASAGLVTVDGVFNRDVDWAVVALELRPATAADPTQYSLNLALNGSGSVDLSPPGGIYNEGTEVTLTAIPDPGYEFTGWSGDLNGSAGVATLVMDSDKSVTATFDPLPPGQYNLLIQVVGGGSVSLDPPGGVYDEGTVVSLTATPDPGYQFAGWSGDLTGSANPASLTMDAHKDVTASFSLINGGIQLEEVQSGVASSLSTVSTGSLMGVAGHLYLAAIASRPNEIVTAVSGLGLTWQPVRTQCSGRDVTGMSVWMAFGSPSGDGPVTATFASSPSNAVIAVARYSGVDSLDPLGNSSSANTLGPSGACSGGVDTDSFLFDVQVDEADSVVLAAVTMRHYDFVPGVGYVERIHIQHGSGGSVASVALVDQEVAAPGTVTVNGGFSRTVDWAAVAVVIRP